MLKLNITNQFFPGEKVTMTAKKIFWRRMKLKCEVEMHNEKDELVCSCVISGMGVPKQ